MLNKCLVAKRISFNLEKDFGYPDVLKYKREGEMIPTELYYHLLTCTECELPDFMRREKINDASTNT